jgi:hypothetical protein
MDDTQLKDELYNLVHAKRSVLTWLEWENSLTDALVEFVQNMKPPLP